MALAVRLDHPLHINGTAADNAPALSQKNYLNRYIIAEPEKAWISNSRWEKAYKALAVTLVVAIITLAAVGGLAAYAASPQSLLLILAVSCVAVQVIGGYAHKMWEKGKACAAIAVEEKLTADQLAPLKALSEEDLAAELAPLSIYPSQIEGGIKPGIKAALAYYRHLGNKRELADQEIESLQKAIAGSTDRSFILEKRDEIMASRNLQLQQKLLQAFVRSVILDPYKFGEMDNYIATRPLNYAVQYLDEQFSDPWAHRFVLSKTNQDITLSRNEVSTLSIDELTRRLF